MVRKRDVASGSALGASGVAKLAASCRSFRACGGAFSAAENVPRWASLLGRWSKSPGRLIPEPAERLR